MNLERLSNDELLARLRAHVGSGNVWLVQLLVYLTEVDARRLYAEHACTSTWDFCVRKLGMSEGEANRRIAAGRVVRDFPVARAYLERGAIHLCAIYALHKYLTEDNHEDLLREALGKTTRAVEEMIRARFPKPDVHPCITPLIPQPALLATPPEAAPPCTVPSPAPTTLQVRARVEPLSASRYRVELTVSAETKGKLERIKDLMRHRNPSGDLETIVDVALDLLLTKLEKERLGKVVRPRAKKRDRATAVDDATGVQGSRAPTPSVPVASAQPAPAANGWMSPVPTPSNRVASAQTPPAPHDQATTAVRLPSDPAADTPMEAASSDQLKRPVLERPAGAMSVPASGAPSRQRDGEEPETTDTHRPPALDTAATNVHEAMTAAGTTTDGPSEVGMLFPQKRTRRGHIPQEVRREVAARDAEQCTYVDAEGNRCPARGFLELDHIEPKALGGGDEAANLRLRCRVHNRLHAEQIFGREYIAHRVHVRRRTRAATLSPSFVTASRGLRSLGFRDADVRNVIARLAAALDPASPAESIVRDALELLT